MKRISNILFTAVLCSVIVCFALGILLLPKKEFSQKENRPLSTVPELSPSAVIQGRYFKELSSFCADHIPFRDGLTSLFAISELSAGKLQVNNVLKAGNTLIALPQYENRKPKSYAKISEFVNSIDNAHIYIPPRSVDIFNFGLPWTYDADSISPVWLEGTENEDFNAIKEASPGQSFYYNTDHHWTNDGAYFAYTQICNRLSISAYEKDFFTPAAAAEDFFGSSYSKSGLPKALCTADTVILPRYAGDTDFILTNHENGQITKGFYDTAALEGEDKYRVFIGGNYSHLTLEHTDPQNRPVLLLIKDSFANSLLPYLALHFDIEIIDPRYCTESYVKEIIREGEYDEILFVLGIDTLYSL